MRSGALSAQTNTAETLDITGDALNAFILYRKMLRSALEKGGFVSRALYN